VFRLCVRNLRLFGRAEVDLMKQGDPQVRGDCGVTGPAPGKGGCKCSAAGAGGLAGRC
jgi:hypothetical protein